MDKIKIFPATEPSASLEDAFSSWVNKVSPNIVSVHPLYDSIADAIRLVVHYYDTSCESTDDLQNLTQLREACKAMDGLNSDTTLTAADVGRIAAEIARKYGYTVTEPTPQEDVENG